MEALQDHHNGNHTRYFEKSLAADHIAGAPWLQKELEVMGVKSQCIVFPERLPRVSLIPSLPEEFCVMSYVPDRRHGMYGGEQIVAAAKALPQIRFEITGGNGSWAGQVPNNVKFLGWVEPLDEIYAHSSVVLRILEHDGIGATVKEALMYGRHVICSYTLPFTSTVRFGDTKSLIDEITRLKSLHDSGSLESNLPGHEFALSQWDEKMLVQELVRFVETIQIRKDQRQVQFREK
jgi:hypothetical protein